MKTSPLHLLLWGFLLIFCTSNIQANVVYDEALLGDLPNTQQTALPIAISAYENIVIGTANGTDDTEDFWEIIVPVGHVIAGVFLDSYVDVNNSGEVCSFRVDDPSGFNWLGSVMWPDAVGRNLISINSTHNLQEGTYIMSVDHVNDLISYQLTIYMIRDNDLCENAIPLSPGDLVEGSNHISFSETLHCIENQDSRLVWYTVQGTGQEFSISTCHPDTRINTNVAIYKGSCNALECVAFETNDPDCGEGTGKGTARFVSMPGQKYYIGIGKFNVPTGRFMLSAETGVNNDRCDTATPIECGETILGTTIDATDDNFSSNCTGSPISYPGVWYSFVGTGDDAVVSTKSPLTQTNTLLSVFTGDCETPFCVESMSDAQCGTSNSTISFPTTTGVTYKILVVSCGDPGIFELSLICGCQPIIDDVLVEVEGCGTGATGDIEIQYTAAVQPVVFVVSPDAGASFTTTSAIINDLPLGEYTVRAIVDGFAAYCSSEGFDFEITAPVDTEAPVFYNCPTEPIVVPNDSGECGAYVNIPIITLRDNCDGILYENDFSGFYEVGEINVGLLLSDQAGNQANCAFSIIVNDTEFPVFTNCPPNGLIVLPNDSGVCEAYVDLVLEATDNCGFSNNSTTFQFPLSNTYSVGDTHFGVGAQDNSGNITSCNFTLRIEDTQYPAINCPTSPLVFTTEPGECGVDVTYVLDIYDNCQAELGIDISNDYTENGGNLDGYYEIGETIVTVQAIDAAGNTTICPVTMIVEENPNLPCLEPCDYGSGTYTIDPVTQSVSMITTETNLDDTDFTEDEQFFIGQQLCGDGEIIARLADINTITGLPGFAGVMMRENCEPGSKHISLLSQLVSSFVLRRYRTITNFNFYQQHIWRPNSGWLRIQRSGNTFIGYVSGNGTNWTFSFVINIPMQECIRVGLVVESYNAQVACEAIFDNITINHGSVSMPMVIPDDVVIEDQSAIDASDKLKPTEAPASFKVYPNPSNGQFTIDYSTNISQNAQVVIYNQLGQMVIRQEILLEKSQSQEFNFSSLNPGMYIINLILEDQSRVSQKIIIE